MFGRTLPIMGWWAAAGQMARELIGLPRPLTLDTAAAVTFDTSPRPVDQVIMAMKLGEASTVSRSQAMSVAAVQRGRNELCSIATLPLRLYRGLDVIPSALFRQFDPDVANVVHMAMTVEDLALEKIAWWQVTGQDFEGFPVSVRRLDPCKVSLTPPGKNSRYNTLPTVQPLAASSAGVPTGRYVWIDRDDGNGPQPFPSSLMIRFDSPNPGILEANARVIRIAMKLDALTEMYAENPALREFFTDSDDTSLPEMKQEDIDAFLAEWGSMRQLRPFGWIPKTVMRVEAGAPNPKDFTLVELRDAVNLAIANGLGVDPEDLGVSTTSRTYQNAVDRKQDKINRVYAPYMSAITDRLGMGDVTRYGNAPRFDLTDYLKSDPVTQAAYWKALQDMGVVDAQWIGEQAGVNSAVVARAATAPPAPAAAPLQNARPPIRLGDVTPRLQLAADQASFTFDRSDFADAPPAPAVDSSARTITGLAVPYNATAVKLGLRYSFRPGSLEYADTSRLKTLMDHVTPVGFHRSVTDSPAGPTVALAILGGPDGSPAKLQRDQLLYDAEHGLYNGLSIGVDFSLDPEVGDVEYDAETDTYNVVRATWRETSVTYMPAFDDARVTKVAASRTGGTMDPCPHCSQRHAAGIACATFAAQLTATPTPTPAPTAATSWHQDPQGGWHPFTAPAPAPNPAPTPPTEPPAGPTPVSVHNGPVQVREPAPYRFDRQGNLRAGTHDFSSDLFLGWHPSKADPAARDRAQTFLREQFDPAAVNQFAITPANVVNLNYPQNHPEMYVDQLEFDYPVWNAVNKGSLDAVTPFVIPKFNSSSGLVADHVTGTEPTPGTFTATAQTITPSAVSGKVEITREAFDQGGNPQMSGLIYRQMTRGYYEALEAYVIAQLVAAAASITDITITTAAVDSALDQGLSAAIVPLQYIRGGNRFKNVFTQIDLYKAMAAAKDTAGRRLYPEIGPQNANGTVEPAYRTIYAHGMSWIPAWATAATGSVAASSWMFDPEKVCAWASPPHQIDIVWRVAWVDLGIWGYKAFGITDFAGTREVIYDPV